MAALLIPSPQGTTRLFAMLGFPVGQVMAPMMMNQLFHEVAHDAVVVPVEVAPPQFDRVVEGLKAMDNFDGMVVTIPHKFALTRHADSMSPAVQLSGAANVLRREAGGRWSVDNFDGQGFVAGLRKHGHDPRGRRISLVGTGGAGSAIATALVQAGAAQLHVFDVDEAKVREIASRLNAFRPDSVCIAEAGPVLDDVEIAINATPLGMQPKDALPFDVARLSPGTVVADVVMKPHETRLLKAAAARGLPVQHGIHMLAPQIEMYRRFFRIPSSAA